MAVADRVILPNPVRNPRRLCAGETWASFSMAIAFSSIGRRIIRIVDEQRNARVLNKCPNVSISVRRHVAGMFPRQEASVTARPDQAFANFAVVFKVAR
jgi:hypothetical protein